MWAFGDKSLKQRSGQRDGTTRLWIARIFGLAYAAPYACQFLKTMMTERQASLFRNGRNQAVRIPREFEMEGTEVMMRKEGDRLILTPVRKNRLLELLASWEPLDEGLSDVEDLPPQTRESL